VKRYSPRLRRSITGCPKCRKYVVASRLWRFPSGPEIASSFISIGPRGTIGGFIEFSPRAEVEKVVDLKNWHLGGGVWTTLDPTDAPLVLRDIGSTYIYALSLEQK